MTALPTTHAHTAFGLAFRSCLPLPELLPAEAAGAADVEIVYGEVAAELPGLLVRRRSVQIAPDRLRLQIDGVAVYLIEEGRRITIARAAEADDAEVRVFLLGSAVGALLHQRDDLVLHGSAVEWDGGAVVFMGKSGAGKSTLATAFGRRGRPILTDDLCVVRAGADGRMLAYPGFPQTKLWLDALKQLDIPPDGLQRILRKLDKRAVPLGEQFHGAPLPVRKLYVLRPQAAGDVRLVPAQGPRKFHLVRNETYRFGFLAGAESKAGHFQQALRLAQQAPIAVAARPRARYELDALVAAIEADLGA